MELGGGGMGFEEGKNSLGVVFWAHAESHEAMLEDPGETI